MCSNFTLHVFSKITQSYDRLSRGVIRCEQPQFHSQFASSIFGRSKVKYFPFTSVRPPFSMPGTKCESFDNGIYKQDNAYFNTESFIILESTDVKKILSLMIRQILHKISTYKKMVQVGILRKY